MADDKKLKEGLPEGWKWVKLGEVAKITTGNSNVQDASDDGVYPFFDRSGEIKRSERYFLDTEAVIVPGEGSDFFPKYFKGKFDLHQRTYAIFNFKGLDGRFLFYLMHLLRVNLIRTAVGTTVLSLRLPHFQNLELPLPPLPEQRKIAQILETVDNAIEKTEKIIEKYKRIKQGLMQDLLTKGIDEKGNIRSEKTHKFKDSPVGRIPEEWEVVRLGEVGEIIDGDWILEKYYTESGVRLIQVGDIGIGKLLNKSNHYISEKSARRLKVKFLKDGQILISRLPDPIGRSCLVPKLPYPAITAVDVSILTVYEDISEKTFIVQILNTDLFFRQCSNLASGTTRFRISRSNLKNILIPLPPLSEQKRIAEILSQIDQAIEKEEKYKEKLERLKKGLMEDLLTGKVRVNKLLEGESHEMA